MEVSHNRLVLDIVPFESLGESDFWLWNSILENDACTQSPFLSYPFTRAVSQSMPGAVFVAVISDENGVVGYFPFQYSAKHLGIAEKVGGHMSDYCGYVLPQGYDIPLDMLVDVCGLNVFRFDHLPEEVPMIDEKDLESSLGLKINIGDDPKAYLERLKGANPSFVKKVRRRERQLAEEYGPLRFEWNSTTPDEALANIVRMKQEQYQRSHVTNAMKEDWTRELLARLLNTGSSSCHAIISTLYAGSTWVASHYGLFHPPVMHCWFPVHNPDLHRFGPGHILRFHMISHANREGITLFDLGQGENPHKREYIVEEYVLRKGVYRRPGLLGLAEKTTQSIKWRAQALGAAHRPRKGSEPGAAKGGRTETPEN